VQGVAAYPSLADCPEVPDLVFVCLPAAVVNEVVDQAGELGIGAVCVVSAGFAELGGEGIALQEELVARARSHGLRVVGPNCMGLLNANADVRMNGTFSTVFPQPGRVSMSSQSGALGMAVLERVQALGLGISTFISVGNKADISGNDLLLYWEQDADTDVALMYLESFGNPRKFSRIARRISRRKPIVAVKSGRTKAGVRAASSHTAAIASGDRAVDALFLQTGVIRTDTLEEMFDVATLLASQPLPLGNNVAVLTNAGGPGILAADALEAQHLDVPALSDRTVAKLREFLPAEAGIANPVDMIASAGPESYARAVEVLGNADEIDSLFVIFIPVQSVDTEELVSALLEASATVPKDVPLVTVIMSSSEGPGRRLVEANIPTFAFPEAAARALGRVHRYSWWRRQPLGVVVEPAGIDHDAARRLADAALATSTRADGAVWLSTSDAAELLRAYGVPLAHARLVDSPEAAAAVQRDLSVPVAVKTAAPIHKADVGGVELGLDTPAAAAAAVERIERALRDHDLDEHVGSYLVQEMVGDGIEMVVGVTHDPSFGPLVLAGAGGTHVELLRDVSMRITPLTDVDVAEMLANLRMAPLLGGYRGSGPADVNALEDLLFRINAMVEDLPEIAELDLNPVFVREEGLGVKAADVRIKLTPAP
jgi:acetate---CoA ligase (ADP-forming)